MTPNVQIFIPVLEKSLDNKDWQALKVYIENKTHNDVDNNLIDRYTTLLLESKHFKNKKPYKVCKPFSRA